MLAAIERAVAEDGRKRLRDACRPFRDTVMGVDQVLADLERHMGIAGRLGVMRHGEAARLLARRIGLVVADDDARLAAQRLEQRHGDPAILVPEHADMPRTLDTAKDRRAAMHRDEARNDTAPL